MVSQLKRIDLSPFPRLKQKKKKDDDFYHGRPTTALTPKSEFHLDYDFEKYNVRNLSDVFGKPGWEVKI